MKGGQKWSTKKEISHLRKLTPQNLFLSLLLNGRWAIIVFEDADYECGVKKNPLSVREG